MPRPHAVRRDEAVRITTAAPSPGADTAARQRRYLWSMALRTFCFVGAVAVGSGWLRWVLIAGAVFLPYVAVIAANAVAPRGGELDLPPISGSSPALSGPEAEKTPLP